VLVEAGSFEGGPGERSGEGIEEQQVGFEVANSVDFVGGEGTFPAFALDELPDGAVPDGGGVAFGAAADVDADDPAVDPMGAGVIAAAIGAGFPGHDGGSRKRRRRGGATQNDAYAGEGLGARLGEI